MKNMIDQISYTENKLFTPMGVFPAELTVMFDRGTDMLLTVHWDTGTKKYLLPRSRERLEEDLMAHSCGNDYCEIGG